MNHKDNKSENKKNERIKPLQSISKLFHRVCDCQGCQCGGIDSHRWESKVEAFRNLSGGYR